MKALIIKDKELRFTSIKKPIIGVGEVLIRILCIGICNTDLEIIKGYMDFQGVPGHEFVGVVEQAPDNSLIGKRVVGEINLGCGDCSYCAAGLQRHCPNRKVLGIMGKDGCMAEYITLPLENIHPIPDELSDQEAIFIEPLAAALEIFQQVHIKPTHKVCIIGDGKLGLLIAAVIAQTAARTMVVGKHEQKLSIVKKIGLEAVTFDNIGDIGFNTFDVCIEATGNPQGLDIALKLVKPRGIIVLKSTYQGEIRLNMAPIVINELMVIGSRCGTFEPAIDFLQRKAFDIRSLITAEYSFDRALEAFELAAKPGSLKVLIRMNS